ncbi:hypothetical protein IW152_003976 [Coemansia sp. BCRC 34962]|nr:hypothetical protein IW152_003976 [Coemansia sp. BCRC 34962]
MSAYGYGLPGLGLTQFLSPDAAILEGVGKGEISKNDLNNIDRKEYGLDRFKAEAGNGCPDPTYPGRFKSEDDDDYVPQRHGRQRHEYDSSAARSALQLATLTAAVLLQFF